MDRHLPSGPAERSPSGSDGHEAAGAPELNVNAWQNQRGRSTTRNVIGPWPLPPANAARGVLKRSQSGRDNTETNTTASFQKPVESLASEQSGTLFATLIWSLAMVEIAAHQPCVLLVPLLALLALLLTSIMRRFCTPQLVQLTTSVRSSLVARLSPSGRWLLKKAEPLCELLHLYRRADRHVRVGSLFSLVPS